MQAKLLREKTGLKPQLSQVLYIDDDAEISTLVRYSLELFAGWYAATTDSRYAMEVAAAGPWNVILLENALDHGRGLSLYHQLKADPRTQAIPIILLTSRVMPADYKVYGQMAIAGVIAKPFNPVTLGTHIAGLMDWSDPCQASELTCQKL